MENQSRARILRYINFNRNALLFCVAAYFLFGLGLFLLAILYPRYHPKADAIGLIIVSSFLAIVSFGLSITSFLLMLKYVGGEHSKYARKHPEMFAAVCCFPPTILIFPQFLQLMTHRFGQYRTIRTEDVLLVHLRYSVSRYSGYRKYPDMIIFELRDGSCVPVLLREYVPALLRRGEINKASGTHEIFMAITRFCPYARIGRTPENLQYLEAMRAAYRQQSAGNFWNP